MSGESTREFIYNAWAPAEGVWSRWVKPVLFSSMGHVPPPFPPTLVTFDLSWMPAANRGAALVLDLPQAEGVLLGLEAARRGFRPVPLYNALPGPTMALLAGDVLPYPTSVVNVGPIVDALWRGTEELKKLSIPSNAPPAFLLDANRRTGWRNTASGCFDNRSVCLVTDFPSTAFLKEHGICRIVLAQRGQNQPQADLSHTLRLWLDGGMEMELKRLDVDGLPAPLSLKRYSKFGEFWYRLCAAMQLVPNRLGGYGGVVKGYGSG